jgi:regulatory protein
VAGPATGLAIGSEAPSEAPGDTSGDASGGAPPSAAGEARRAAGGDPPGAARPRSAYNAALNLLAMRDHSRAELAERLARREFTPEAIEAALVRLEQAHLIDDAAYAAAFAASRAARGVAATVIRRDLAAKGIDGALAARAAAQASPADTEAERCRELAAAWLSRRTGLPAQVAARRLGGYLARRGYPPGMITAVVLSLTGREPGSDPDDPLG